MQDDEKKLEEQGVAGEDNEKAEHDSSSTEVASVDKEQSASADEDDADDLDDIDEVTEEANEEVSAGDEKSKDFKVGYQKVDLSQQAQQQQEGGEVGQKQPFGNIKDRISSEVFSQVATSAANRRLTLIGFAIAIFFVAYYVFSSVSKDTKEDVAKKEQAKLEERKEDLIKTAKPITPPPTASETEFKVEVPKLPSPPPLVTPQPPEPPPPPVPATPQPPVFPSAPQAPATPPAPFGSVGGQPASPSAPPASLFATPSSPGGSSTTSVTSLLTGKDEEEEKKKKMEDRRKANSLIVGGGGGGSGGDASSGKGGGKAGDKDEKDKDGQKAKDKSGFLGFDEGSFGDITLAKTSAQQIKATYVGKLDSLIAQGKIIYAVLETAINTDLPGTLRAIITRDVYAESGKAVLIPKGSRVIGEYQTQIKNGQSRVGVKWNRLIRPDGIDLQLDAPGIDQLGRSGVQGFVDSKFWLQMGAAVLTSYIVPTIANRLANIKDKPITTTVTTQPTGGATTTTQGGSSGSSQLQQSSQQFQQIAKDVIEKSFNTEPNITVDQGVRVNIFVNKDIIFPSSVAIKSMKVLK